jgi:hypothetical protein
VVNWDSYGRQREGMSAANAFKWLGCAEHPSPVTLDGVLQLGVP